MAEKKNGSNGKRFQIQSIALAVSLLSPFGIYSALQAGSTPLAALGFAILAVAMAVVVVKG
jgi:hypothetical protein